jgi:uncharacterized protein YjiS (DUF1127 family)
MSVHYTVPQRRFRLGLFSRSMLVAGGETLNHIIAISRQRRRLTDLDAHMLEDVGVSRWEAEREAGRPFWDVPRHWRV